MKTHKVLVTQGGVTYLVTLLFKIVDGKPVFSVLYTELVSILGHPYSK